MHCFFFLFKSLHLFYIYFVWFQTFSLDQTNEVARKKSRFLFYLLFGCPMVNLGNYWGNSLTNPMLITAFLQFDVRITGSLIRYVPRVRSLSPAKHLASFELDSLRFKCNALTRYTLFSSFLVIYYRSWFQKITSKFCFQ